MRVRVPPPAPFLNVKPVCEGGFLFGLVCGWIWCGLGKHVLTVCRGHILALAICAGVSGGRRWVRPALLLGRYQNLLSKQALASLCALSSTYSSTVSAPRFPRASRAVVLAAVLFAPNSTGLSFMIEPNPPAHRHRPLNVSGRARVL